MPTRKDGAESNYRPNHRVRLPVDLWEAMAALAKRHGRPVSWEIQFAIMEWIKQKNLPAEGQKEEKPKG